MGRRFEVRFERHARRIRDNISLLRLAVIIMRRMVMITLAALLWLAYAAIRAADFAVDAHLVFLAAALASAWVLISIVTRLIRNRVVGRLAAILAWSFVALRLTGLWAPLASGLDATAMEIGGMRLSLLVMLQAGFIVAAALWVAIVLGRVIEDRLSHTEELTPSLRVLIGKLVRIGLIVLATVVALTSIGIDLTALTVFSGALGVGIGFGLQKVVSNYLSGIIILADKSIKPGDTISLGDKVGWVRSIRARFVSIVTRDGVEFLIPNEDFITNRVINLVLQRQFRAHRREFRRILRQRPASGPRAGRGSRRRRREGAEAARTGVPSARLRRFLPSISCCASGSPTRATVSPMCAVRSSSPCGTRSGRQASRSPTRIAR